MRRDVTMGIAREAAGAHAGARLSITTARPDSVIVRATMLPVGAAAIPPPAPCASDAARSGHLHRLRTNLEFLSIDKSSLSFDTNVG